MLSIEEAQYIGGILNKEVLCWKSSQYSFATIIVFTDYTYIIKGEGYNIDYSKIVFEKISRTSIIYSKEWYFIHNPVTLAQNSSEFQALSKSNYGLSSSFPSLNDMALNEMQDLSYHRRYSEIYERAPYEKISEKKDNDSNSLRKVYWHRHLKNQ